MDPNSPHRWTAQYPELGTGPVSVLPYYSPEHFELERKHIFMKMWLNVGRVQEVPNAGDYLVKDVQACNASALIVRGNDGQIRAFHNMCSHRGNRLMKSERGRALAVTCGFHGWSYNLDGALRAIPDEKRFFNLDRSKLGLTPIRCETWGGFIFLSFDPKSTVSLREYLGEIADDLEGYPFEDVTAQCYAFSIQVQANWKVVKDAFQETYHVAFLHRKSLPDSFTSPSNPLSLNSDYRIFGPHHRTSLYANRERASTPTERIARKHGGMFTGGGGMRKSLPPALLDRKNWGGDMNVIFPNFFLDVGASLILSYSMWPLAVDRTHWEVRVYMRKPKNPAERFAQEYNVALLRDTLSEDASTVEGTQSVLPSGGKSEFYLQDEEILVRHDTVTIAKLINSAEGGQ